LSDAAHVVEGMMQHFSEANRCARNDAQSGRENIRVVGVCGDLFGGVFGGVLIAGMILGIAHPSEVRAAEPPFAPANPEKPDFNAASLPAPAPAFAPALAPAPAPAPASAFTLSLPPSYQFGDLSGFKPLPDSDFRPRGRSILEKESRPGAADDAPMLRGTTVWQRMGDFRSRDRVRVVTLWETGGSSVSLQAGRKGNPSLQWTSRLMNRGGATRGLLDQAFSTSIGGVVRNLHLTPHPSGADALGKPSKAAEFVPGSGAK
jgi:hypothetical protein